MPSENVSGLSALPMTPFLSWGLQSSPCEHLQCGQGLGDLPEVGATDPPHARGGWVCHARDTGVFGGFGREEPTQFLLFLPPLLKAQTCFFSWLFRPSS